MFRRFAHRFPNPLDSSGAAYAMGGYTALQATPGLEAGLEQLIATGGRAHELALRFKYGGVPSERIEVVSELEHGLDRALEQTPAGGELVVLPTYTAMLALRRIAADRGLVRPYWEEAA